MRRFQNWFFLCGAILLFETACLGQIMPATNPNAGPQMSVAGTVLDASGAPAPGVTVMVVPLGVGPITQSQTQSDAGGKYALKWQARAAVGAGPAAAYSVLARDTNHNLAAIHAVDETTTNLDLRLQPGLTISAKVQDTAGKPIPSATGTLFLYPGTTGAGSSINRAAIKADDQGSLQLTALPQGFRYSAMIRAPGYGAPGMTTIQAAETQITRLDLPPVVLKLASLKLAGQVLGADGQPAAGVRVMTSGLGQVATNALTDATGHFSFTVCDGPVSIMATLQATVGQPATGRATAAGGDTNVVVRLASVNTAAPTGVFPDTPAARGGVTITGTVFDPSGAPAPGVSMSVTPSTGVMQDIRSDASGKFAVSWQPFQFAAAATPPNIEYLLMGRDLEHNFASVVRVDDKTTNMDLHLQGGFTLSGAVQDSDGLPVKSASVRLLLTAQGTSSMVDRQPAQVDALGVFGFKALPQGRAYLLTVTAAGFGTLNQQVPAGETQTAKLELPPIKLKSADQRLEGQVLGPDDKPMAGVMVQVSGVGQPNARTNTDASGHFALKVCEGTLRVFSSVQPSASGNGQYLSTSVQAQGGDLNVVVKLAARQVNQPAAVVMNRAQLRLTPLKEPSWTWAAVCAWPQQHRTAMFVLLGAQIAILFGTAGAVFWVTRARRS